MTGHHKNICVCLTMILLFALACTSNANSYFEKGKRLAKQGKEDEALLNIRKALQKDPTLAAAYLEISDIYIKQNNRPEAYRALTQAVEMLPSNGPGGRVKEGKNLGN